MMEIPEALTFDDILLLPNYSEILPEEAELTTSVTRNITLKIPLMSAAMDTVTEASMAIQLAKSGGMGVIHRNMSAEKQAEEVRKVKKFETWIITSPITLNPNQTVGEAISLMNKYSISGLPVTRDGYLVGLITRRDLRFETNTQVKVEKIMRPSSELVTVSRGITPEDAKKIMHEKKIEKLPIVDDDGKLEGLVTLKDIEKAEAYPEASKDYLGRLMVGAAIGVGPTEIERAGMLEDAGADVIVVDTAHGHTKAVLETIKELKNLKVDVIAGNVGTYEGAEAIAKAGVDAVKVGVGPGSICTTRVITGVGVPQVTAILECSKALRKYRIPLIADGGVKFSGDVVKALAVGADVVMLGNMFAGTDEAPGEVIIWKGRSYKVYRGMGSQEAIEQGRREGIRSRYIAEDDIVPEGIVGIVPYKGPVAEVIKNIVGGIKGGMGYLGAGNIKELREKTRFVRITSAGLRESHVHDVFIMKEAPNYRLEW